MAGALQTDPINQLEENLQCTVCLEVLTDPRTLPCLHSFCKVCLEGIVETLRGKARLGGPIREFPCPNCRATFILDPDKHVADMPRNHFICNMVKVAAVLDRGIGVPCSHNCSQSYSVARCVTCEKFLCRECLTGHNNYRANNGHSVLTMEELSKPENRKKINDKMYCNEHTGKKLKVYCETCNQLICRDCMDFKHVKQGHSCVLVKDIANNYKELLASNGKAMEDALTEGNAFLQRLTLTTQQLDRDAENAKNKIAQRKEFVAKKIIEILDQKAESFCKKVDEIHKGKRANLEQQTEETKLYVENIKTSVQLSKKLVDQGSEEEIISSQKMILDNANNLLADREEYFKARIPDAKLSYTSSAVKEPINEEILRELANSLGEVNETSKDTGSQGGKSSLNPKAPAFSIPGSRLTSPFDNAAIRNMIGGQEGLVVTRHQ
ncbi:tripartite motif-containing 45-like [Paramuricea clavata]|uniref:Tripartite motif-containing 45-like n=1 Tax=Paramuricea clavata TaxID=317549 RepID=A0A6S7JP14_PARCT|nr:tripartite motif-containing 45-like [Paramuricea clavata]